MVNGKSMYHHRWVWEQAHGEIPPKMQIHHINGDIMDNRLENLDMISCADHLRKPDNFGKGYSIIKSRTNRPYKAGRQVWGKKTFLGYFGTPCGAHMAYLMAYI